MIRRRITRTILNTTEITKETKDPNADTAAFVLTTTDKFYVGFHGPFASRYFTMGTANTNSSVLSVKYWDGSAFVAVEDLVDETEGMSRNGWLHWQNKTDWVAVEQSPINDVKLYWIEVTTDADFSAGTTIQSVMNLYSDDILLRAYYPELVDDPRYLPPGRTDFLEQHLAAHDMVALRLQQRRLIDDESQIIDINEVAIAAVHAVAWILLRPIATSDEAREQAATAEKNFNDEIGQLSLGVDLNKDGTVSTVERSDFGEVRVVRR